ncbi:hypothetical protein J5N97_004432 [Dioscorea zingiberensis]|uniref:Uncharacterized protein n=1 Tax=Dioscorea zingiberensis TaxID=325984 RepID=A0A9D5D672_9LILI|nr:hypothetical protein J5N97_004432 [Dioscorea zingiberensis]
MDGTDDAGNPQGMALYGHERRESNGEEDSVVVDGFVDQFIVILGLYVDDSPMLSNGSVELKAPGTGELVITGADVVKPFLVLGVISADGERLAHTVDIKLERSILCHDIGVTERLMKYEKESYARIGVMPRYGDAESIKWFHVQPYCTFHLINAYEDGDEVVVRGCRASESIIPGPEFGLDKFKWFSRGLTFQEIEEE